MANTTNRSGTSRTAIHEGDRQLRRAGTRFGEEFRLIRLRTGVSQAAVARAIGVDRASICRIEAGDPTCRGSNPRPGSRRARRRLPARHLPGRGAAHPRRRACPDRRGAGPASTPELACTSRGARPGARSSVDRSPPGSRPRNRPVRGRDTRPRARGDHPRVPGEAIGGRRGSACRGPRTRSRKRTRTRWPARIQWPSIRCLCSRRHATIEPWTAAHPGRSRRHFPAPTADVQAGAHVGRHAVARGRDPVARGRSPAPQRPRPDRRR